LIKECNRVVAKKKLNSNGKRPAPAPSVKAPAKSIDVEPEVATELRVTEPRSRAERASSRRVRARAPLLNTAPALAKSASTLIPPLAPEALVEPAPIPSAFIDRGLPIPDSYGIDRLVALVRDPVSIYCYWELSNGRLPDVRNARGQEFIDACAWVLRLYRLNENTADEMEVDPSIGNWYFNVGRPGRYQIEMGLLSPDGEWISLLFSRIVETPPNKPSDVIDDEWRLRPEDEEILNKALRGSTADAAGRGTSGFLGASRLMSSFSVVSSMGMVGSSASGKPVAGSWAFSFQGSSRAGSSGSGGFGWTIAPNGAHEPLLERPTHDSGPNWNAQPELQTSGVRKTAQENFKVKLPRRLLDIRPPAAETWPPVEPPKKALRRKS